MESINERQQAIVDYLKEQNYVAVNVLCEHFNYSSSTIKRDLSILEAKGLIRRVRGGAVPLDESKFDIPYIVKATSYKKTREKDLIARASSKLIKDGMFIALDSSTTDLHLIKYISRLKNLLVVTNGIITAALLSEQTRAQISILGGCVSLRHQTVNGTRAYKDMLSYNVDIALISCKYFNFSNGASESDKEEALLKTAMCSQAKHSVLMVDSGKMGQASAFQSLPLDDVDYLCTDAMLNSEEKNVASLFNIKIINI